MNGPDAKKVGGKIWVVGEGKKKTRIPRRRDDYIHRGGGQMTTLESKPGKKTQENKTTYSGKKKTKLKNLGGEEGQSCSGEGEKKKKLSRIKRGI